MGLRAFQVDYLRRFQGGNVALWTHSSHIHFPSIYPHVRVVEKEKYIVQQGKSKLKHKTHSIKSAFKESKNNKKGRKWSLGCSAKRIYSSLTEIQIMQNTWECLCVCIHMCTHPIYENIYVCIHMHTHSIHEKVYVCKHMHTNSACENVCVCIYMCTHSIHENFYVYAYICVRIPYMRIFVFAYICVHIPYMRMFMCMHTYAYTFQLPKPLHSHNMQYLTI